MTRLFAGLAVLAAIAVFVLVGRSARDWNPALSHDTCVYYYQEIKKLNGPVQNSIVTNPFKVPVGTTEPDAAQAKPVFIVLLNLWHTGYKWLDSSLVFPDNRIYSDFIFSTLVLALLSFAWLGWRLGYPWLGLLSGLIAFVNAWALTVVYFDSYTAVSFFLLSIAFGLIYKKRPVGTLVAGALMAADILINQSVTVFMVSYAGLAFFLPNTLRQRLYSLACYLCGAALAWLSFESIVLAENITNNWLYIPVYKVLLSYLNRSMTELSVYFSVYEHTLFPLMVWKNSVVFSVGFVACLVVTVVAMRKKWRSFLDRPETSLLFVVILTLILIDWRTGPKFSRTYFLVFPFTVLFTVISCYEIWQRAETAKRWVSILIAGVFLLYLAECVQGLQSQKTAFLAARGKILASFESEMPIFFFRDDTYAPFFFQLSEDKTVGSSPKLMARFVSDLCDPGIDDRFKSINVMVGPNIPSVINLPGYFTETVSLPLNPDVKAVSGVCRDKSWKAVLEERVPFFSHYPYLMLEDPRETYRLQKDRTIGWEDYKSGIGRVSLWKVMYEAGGTD